jgi:inorganic pyrophosphatase
MSRSKRIVTGMAVVLAAQWPAFADRPQPVLPAMATASLAQSLSAASQHGHHVWRDTPPWPEDGRVTAYIEIPRGDRRKWEFEMRTNARRIDRILPEQVGGYPVNYGFVPQTISYDGDPFDALVLGPPVAGGELTPGVVVGLMLMEDEKGLDSKVVLSPVDSGGRPEYVLSDAERRRIADYFRRYKQHETGKFSKVPGWGTAADGHEYVALTHAFFRECRQHPGAACTINR